MTFVAQKWAMETKEFEFNGQLQRIIDDALRRAGRKKKKE